MDKVIIYNDEKPIRYNDISHLNISKSDDRYIDMYDLKGDYYRQMKFRSNKLARKAIQKIFEFSGDKDSILKLNIMDD